MIQKRQLFLYNAEFYDVLDRFPGQKTTISVISSFRSSCRFCQFDISLPNRTFGIEPNLTSNESVWSLVVVASLIDLSHFSTHRSDTWVHKGLFWRLGNGNGWQYWNNRVRVEHYSKYRFTTAAETRNLSSGVPPCPKWKPSRTAVYRRLHVRACFHSSCHISALLGRPMTHEWWLRDMSVFSRWMSIFQVASCAFLATY